MRFPYTKQVIVVVGAGALIAGLVSLDLKPPKTTKAKDERSTNHTEKKVFLFEEELNKARKGLSDETLGFIKNLENKLEQASGAEKSSVLRTLAEAWYGVAVHEVSAGYYTLLAKAEPKPQNYLQAGDEFRLACKNTRDSALIPALMAEAITNYQKVLEMEPQNLKAKTGLGACYVEGGSENPMKGISLLLEVVKEDPKNVNANLNLGIFSMRSGQFKKAVSRFKTVAEQQPTVESYAYLAEAYEKSGDKAQAINALEKAKEYAIDPTVKEGIDSYIQSLK